MRARTAPALRWLEGALNVGAGLYVLVYVVLALKRLQYPYELEWMEGGVLDHVRRVLQHHALYVEPSLDFTPYIYPPLYYYAAAGVAALTGLSFVPLRLVSIASSVGCFGIIYFWVRRETGRATPAVLAAGLFAATYKLSGAWLDIGRIDSLFLVLFLGAAILLAGDVSPWRSAVAGILFTLSFFTKQTALVMAVPLAVVVIVRAWKAGVVFVGVAAATTAGAMAVFQRVTGGWYGFYVFDLPSRHAHNWSARVALSFFTDDLCRSLGIAVVIGAVFVAISVRARDRRLWQYPALLIGALAGAWFSRIHVGAFDNALIPACAVIGMVFGLGVDRIERWTETLNPVDRNRARWTTTFACLVQMASLFYDPRLAFPTKADRAAGHELVATIARLPGDVFVPSHGGLSALDGKPPHAHAMAIRDVLWAGGPVATRLQATIDAAIREQRFSAVVVDTNWFLPTLETYYTPRVRLFTSFDPTAFYPITGLRTRPDTIYMAK